MKKLMKKKSTQSVLEYTEYLKKIRSQVRSSSKLRQFNSNHISKPKINKTIKKSYSYSVPLTKLQIIEKFNILDVELFNRIYIANHNATIRCSFNSKVSIIELYFLVLSSKNCFWCGISLDGNFHIDHFYPLSKGGKHSISNLVISCPFCNLSKGCKLPSDFINYLKKVPLPPLPC